jgi:SPP1 family predicted phage head-tail adaptor
MITPGAMRERVTVQIASGTTNALGETVLTWSDSTSVWASVNGVSAREQLISGQNQVAISHRIVMRYLPGLTQSMRLSWRSRTLEIMSLLEHGNRSEHELLCQENV